MTWFILPFKSSFGLFAEELLVPPRRDRGIASPRPLDEPKPSTFCVGHKVKPDNLLTRILEDVASLGTQDIRVRKRNRFLKYLSIGTYEYIKLYIKKLVI